MGLFYCIGKSCFVVLSESMAYSRHLYFVIQLMELIPAVFYKHVINTVGLFYLPVTHIFTISKLR